MLTDIQFYDIIQKEKGDPSDTTDIFKHLETMLAIGAYAQ